MSQAPRAHRPLLLGAAALAVAALLATSAAAQMREFTGRVNQVNAQGMVVGNRMGDQLSFARTPKTKVRGAKGDWEAIRPADHVTVHWHFGDKPAQARRVVVLPR